MPSDPVLVWLRETFSATWETLNSSNLPEMSSELIATTRVYLDRLTLGGNLPALPTLIPPPTTAVQVRKGFVARALEGVREHFVVALLVGTGVGSSLVYFYVPRSAYRPILKPIRPFIPILLLPTSTRPIHIPATPTTPEIRREATLVLGCGSPLIVDLVLDLERRGFIVICTVADVRDVDIIERRSRGWIKVLLLNPEDSTSVGPFLKSFSTALSLRFPLRTAGDPFARPDHVLGLTTVINCLSLHEMGAGGGLGPVEGIDLDNVRWMLGERVATVIGVLKGVLPIMRPISERTNAEESIILTLLSSTTANLSLPFQALLSASDAALISLLDSLRRELSLAQSSSNIRVAILEVGFFASPTPSATASSPTGSTAPTAAMGGQQTQQPLSARLSSIYAPALARRSITPSPSSPLAPTTPSARIGRSPSNPKQLSQKIFDIIAYGRGGSRSRVGAGSTTYRVLGGLPVGVMDGLFAGKDWVARGFEGGVKRLGLGTAGGRVGGGGALGGGGGARPPLPQTPSQQTKRRTSSTASSSASASGSGSNARAQQPTVPRSNSTTSSASSTTNLLNSTIASDQYPSSIPDLSAHPTPAQTDTDSSRGASIDGRPSGDVSGLMEQEFLNEAFAARMKGSGDAEGGEGARDGTFSFVGSEVDWRET